MIVTLERSADLLLYERPAKPKTLPKEENGPSGRI